MRAITLIILHCSASRCNRRYSFEQCRNDHVRINHWKDIGYHYYVEQDGTICQGRPEAMAGAHCKNHNQHSIGVCYEGGLDESGQPADTRTDAQKTSLRQLLSALHCRYPHALILGHRDLNPTKACPCYDVAVTYRDLQP